MLKLLGLFFFVAGAVLIGLGIAYWYLRRVEDERRRVRRQARVVPLPEKHRPVDLTPDTSSVHALVRQTDAAAPASEAGEQRPRRDAVEAEQRPVVAATPALAARETAVSDAGKERDDLKRISGVGPKLEQLLNAYGVFRFHQIAEWQDADIEAIAEQLGAFRGRIRRDDWVGQAKDLSD